jgi:hypothetical protein
MMRAGRAVVLGAIVAAMLAAPAYAKLFTKRLRASC